MEVLLGQVVLNWFFYRSVLLWSYAGGCWIMEGASRVSFYIFQHMYQRWFTIALQDHVLVPESGNVLFDLISHSRV